ncbi:MAG: GHMP family kinase ATP-binding protein [Bdellovibrionota bacterium]
MIITRTPLRISIGGGGTDLPSYYEPFGGFVISAAINHYIYIALHETFVPNYIIKYSEMETVESVPMIKHPIVREAFKLHDVQPYIEMVSMADIPAGTGLGSSGAFNVGLLRGIYALKREHITTQALAEEACHIELDLLKEPIGKQDQYIAAFGGLTCMEFGKDGKVNVSPLKISRETLHDLEDNLLMFFTGYSRSASKVLSDQKTRSEKNDKSMLDNLHFVKELGFSIKKALEAGDTHAFAQMMHQHWLHKKERSGGISNENINRWYDVGFANGALGGKLIGAGGGGFILFYANDRVALRKAMAKEGLVEVRFSFDHEGSKVVSS